MLTGFPALANKSSKLFSFISASPVSDLRLTFCIRQRRSVYGTICDIARESRETGEVGQNPVPEDVRAGAQGEQDQTRIAEPIQRALEREW
jgi:hypothetical protein